jgi:hypothetical protein
MEAAKLIAEERRAMVALKAEKDLYEKKWGVIAFLTAVVSAFGSSFFSDWLPGALFFGALFSFGYVISREAKIYDRLIAGCEQAIRSEEKREQERQETQKQLLHRLSVINTLHSAQLSILRRIVTEVTATLDIAEKELKERAFAPFWSAIETVLVRLAAYTETARNIPLNAAEYQQIKDQLGPAVACPSLECEFGPSVIPDSSRLRDIVRQAQTDYEFSSIYEARMTNHILVTGFTTLDSALRQLPAVVDSSVGALAQLTERRLESIESKVTGLEKVRTRM